MRRQPQGQCFADPRRRGREGEADCVNDEDRSEECKTRRDAERRCLFFDSSFANSRFSWTSDCARCFTDRVSATKPNMPRAYNDAGVNGVTLSPSVQRCKLGKR